MAVTYNSGTSVAPGNSYTPDDVTDAALIWIAYARRPGPTDLEASGWLFGATSMTEAPDTDHWNDIAGGGDPTAACGYLANPGTTGQTLDVTYSNSTTAEFGFAMTLAGAHQTSTVSDSGGAAYGSDASPSLTYTAPAGSLVIYWRAHAQSSDTVWTDPTGFTNREDFNFVTSPSFRTFAVWTKEVATTETSVTVSATSDSAGDGGVHGFIVVDQASGATTTPQSGTFSGTGTAALSTVVIYGVNPSMTATGSSLVFKEVKKGLSMAATATSSLVKTVGKALGITATGTTAQENGVAIPVNPNMTATGTSSNSQTFIAAPPPALKAMTGVILKGIAFIGKLIKGEQI